MTVYAAVFARGGSKGLSGKNLLELDGVPLVAVAIELAKEIPGVRDVLCSTDSEEIAQVARDYGATVPFLRPAHLASDESPEWDSWKHLVAHLLKEGAHPDDTLVVLPPTSPLRSLEDVERGLKHLAGTAADVVVSMTASSRNPWFNMVTVDDKGYVSLVMEFSNGEITRRQSAPQVFDLTTVVYVTTLGYVHTSKRMLEGTVAGIEIPTERAIDIDSAFDYEIAQLLVERRRRGA